MRLEVKKLELVFAVVCVGYCSSVGKFCLKFREQCWDIGPYKEISYSGDDS